MHSWRNWITHLTTNQKIGGSTPSGCTNTDINMDNLSGKADYIHRGEKKKNKVEAAVVVPVDIEKLKLGILEMNVQLMKLMLTADSLYKEFPKKGLNDMSTTLGMAKGSLKKLSDDLENK